MGGRVDTILMYVKFGDDPVSSLDFSFTVGCTLQKQTITFKQLNIVIIIF